MRRETHYPQILNHFKNEWGEKWMEFIKKIGYHSQYGHPWWVFENKNFTMDMLQKHPPTTDDFQSLSGNPNLTIDIIKQYAKRKWDSSKLCKNPALGIDDLMKLRKFFSWKYVCDNPNFTFDLVLQHPRIKWNWTWVSPQQGVTMDAIEQNMDKPWDWFEVCSNPNLTVTFVRKHLDKLNGFCWRNISKNSTITMDIIGNNLDLPWNWSSIQYNPNLTIEFIEKHPDREWNADCVNRCKFPPKTPTMQDYHKRHPFIQSYRLRFENFDEDRNAFISHRVSWLFFVSIYEYYCEMSISKKRKRFEYGDLVFSNNYLMNMIVKY